MPAHRLLPVLHPVLQSPPKGLHLYHLSCRESCEKSLKDLGCKYLDLMLMHWPDAWEPCSGDPGKTDELVTIQQTW